MARYEFFATADCPWCREMREWLEWNGHEFVEYDVDADAAAMARMTEVSGGQRMVPLLVEGGRVAQLGWQGRGCMVGG